MNHCEFTFPGIHAPAPPDKAPLPLEGRRILLTRPQPEAESTARRLEELGALVLRSPVLCHQPPDDPHPFLEALSHPERYQGIIFTSVHAVRAVLDTPCPHDRLPRVHAVGNRTAALLRQANLHPIVPKHPRGGEELARELIKTSAPGDRFLFPRAQEGREELVTALREAGRTVDLVAAYAMAAIPHLDHEILERLDRRHIDAIPFFSGRTAQVFLELLPEPNRLSRLERPLLAALSPTTADAMTKAGMRVDRICHRPDLDSMIQTLIEALPPPIP
ncbi:MAG: uroporphyrinogen-III synthase [Magnetococcales bacterium]|nr:uroporphyrinogen-III synthase [Magnetococcales bacterium]